MFSVRLAEPADSATIRQWRNDPLTVAMSVTSGTVTVSEHEQWYGRALRDPRQTIYIGLYEGASVGVCRFELDDETGRAEVSINLNPAMRGKGLALPLLQTSIDSFTRGEGVVLTATINNANAASRRIFSRCGFKLARAEAEYSRYTRAAG